VLTDLCLKGVLTDLCLTLYNALNVNYQLFLSDFNKTEISLHIFEKYLDIKFPEHSPCVSLVPCGRTGEHD